MTQEELDIILERHKHYVNRDIENWRYMRADFSEMDLYGLTFYNVNLKDVNFRNANLSRTIFNFVDLTGARMSGADLSNATFYSTCNLAELSCFDANTSNCRVITDIKNVKRIFM